MIAETPAIVGNGTSGSIDDESAAHDCSALPETLDVVHFEAEGADCNGENEKAISKEENRP